MQETSEGQTYYCKGCEEEARNPNITPPPHTCGKKVNINYTPNQSPKQMHERFDDWKNIVEYFFKFQAVNHYPEDKNKLIENLEPIMKQQTTLAYDLGKKEMLEMVVKWVNENEFISDDLSGEYVLDSYKLKQKLLALNEE